jgi:hypothetical protein
VETFSNKMNLFLGVVYPRAKVLLLGVVNYGPSGSGSDSPWE